ncbi:cytochrome c1 [Psychrobacter sp. YP14]|uniref:Cytochrome c1 n=3 Tax=Psychrobacter TaxID=497 RepID=A0A844LZR1_9GAMM|nr:MULTISPECIES: cytochrome c1 [Psychrobacter]AWT48772.1 cytochrome c1 [Psychrobacter sp. YP14]MUG32013.1 cytochrome c1 [Psychrobacter sanguinis]UNK06107.1 cytochrome c1 [Psychrobacter sp. PraFG1]
MSALTKSLTGFGFGVALTLAATTSAQAAGGEGCGTFTNADGVEEHLACSTAPIDFANKGSLQRGATMFMNYCAGCHTAKYVRHSRIAQDLEIPPELVEKYLLVTSDQIGDQIDNGIDPEIQASWFGAPPPDLSLETRLRGDDWVYTYLLSFYEDPSRPWGANNLVLHNAAMPHVLMNLQNQLGEEEYRSRVGDLVNFMAWMAEPVREDRQRYGFFVIIFLLILLIPVYLLNKEFWKDVK